MRNHIRRSKERSFLFNAIAGALRSVQPKQLHYPSPANFLNPTKLTIIDAVTLPTQRYPADYSTHLARTYNLNLDVQADYPHCRDIQGVISCHVHHCNDDIFLKKKYTQPSNSISPGRLRSHPPPQRPQGDFSSQPHGCKDPSQPCSASRLLVPFGRHLISSPLAASNHGTATMNPAVAF